jgi:TldD protein
MNITADATIPGALATYGYDDEGTPAQRVTIVKEGTWVGVLSGRDSAHLAGLPPGGMVRADGFNRMPMVRMTNVGLLPGDSSLDEIVARDQARRADGDQPVLVDRRPAAELPVRLRDRLGGRRRPRHRMVKNPTYTGITPRFWATLDMLAGEQEWVPWGCPTAARASRCRSGTPGIPDRARFRNVRVGVKGDMTTG